MKLHGHFTLLVTPSVPKVQATECKPSFQVNPSAGSFPRRTGGLMYLFPSETALWFSSRSVYFCCWG